MFEIQLGLDRISLERDMIGQRSLEGPELDRIPLEGGRIGQNPLK